MFSFIGNSITDCGRRVEHAPLGNGYVSLFKDLVDVSHPQLRLRVVKKGISGDTVLGPRERWEDDVLSYSPKLISILIGINDLHRYLRGEEEYSSKTTIKLTARYSTSLGRGLMHRYSSRPPSI